MGFVERFRTGKHLRVLRNAERAAPEAVAEAKSALREVGAAAIPALLEVLSDPKARAAAREVLESLLTNETLTSYMDALGSDDRRIQREVVEILKHGRHYGPDHLLDFLASSDVPRGQVEAVLLARLESLDPSKLLDALPDFERETRAILYRLIEETANPSVAPKAAALIEHSDWWIRAHMAKLLGGIPGEHAEAALSRALGDRNKSVRLRAVKSLRRLRATACVPTLVKVLRDGDLTVQAAAIDALIEIADASAVPDLIEVLKDDDEQARRGAVEVLNEVATPEAIQDLVFALRDADWWVRVRAADALGTIGGEKVVEAILGLMDDPDVQVRRYAIEILNTIPDGRSVESLLKALNDEDWWVRERSIDALGRAGDERAVEPLLTLLGSDPAAAPLCARALGDLGQAEAAAPLIALLAEGGAAEVTREAVDALVKIAKAGVPADLHARLETALREHGVRLEKTRQRPMEIRAGAAQAPPRSSDAVSLVLEKPLKRPESRGPAPELAHVPTNVRTPGGGAASAGGSDHTFLPEDIAEGTQILDRYRVVRQIGRGGFSTVFLVDDEAISDRVILKVLSPHLTEDESMAERFVRELKLARRVAHKNVIRIHDLLQIGRSKAISMEYFASEDLGDLLDREEKLTPERGTRLAIQICAGLAAAHDAGVIHRDVKPANVLVGENDSVKLVDFGLASVGREMENRLTRTGHLVGTPHYMAPELIRGEEVGAGADLYSFGVMMYEMFSGDLPYDGDNAMAILFRHLDGDARPLTEVVPGFPEELGRVVMGAMNLDRGQRPENARLLQELLEKAAP